MTQPIRIAMWSGPRNISTAMMRAWENRPDTIVHDEPLYAHYLDATGVDHPGRQEVIEAGETDWRRVVRRLTKAKLPSGYSIYYQKHMTHHLLPEVDLEWVEALVNCFLIRDPREVITSYVKVRPDVRLADIGFEQQWRLFQRIRRRTGQVPPVLDARDVLEDPRARLTALCERVGVPFYESMLGWPAGSRPSDGVWAKYWYGSVHASTGFAPYRAKPDQVPDHLRGLLKQADEIYQEMVRYRLT